MDELGEESPDPKPPGRAATVAIAVLFEGGLAPLALALGWLLGQAPWQTLSWRARDAAIGALAALPMLGFFLFAMRWPIGPLGRIKKFLEEEVPPLLGRCTYLELAVISLAAGVGEETLCRGLIQAALSRRLGLWAGLALASLVFGLLHPITPGYIVVAAALGAYLGTVWVVNGNLLSAIVAHALYDFVALVMVLRKRPRYFAPRA